MLWLSRILFSLLFSSLHFRTPEASLSLSLSRPRALLLLLLLLLAFYFCLIVHQVLTTRRFMIPIIF